MTLQEIQTLVAAGYTKADIDALQPQPVLAQQAPAAQPAPIVQQPQIAPAIEPQQALSNDFVAALQTLGAAINQPAQPAPTNVLPASLQQPQQAQPQAAPIQQPQAPIASPQVTPSNAGITPEEATKLFQAWSMGQATQNIELPPSADDILAQRFASLYGVDTSKKTNK